MTPNSVVTQAKRPVSCWSFCFLSALLNVVSFLAPLEGGGVECLMKHLLDLTVRKTTLETCNEPPRTHVAKLAKNPAFLPPFLLRFREMRFASSYFAERKM